MKGNLIIMWRSKFIKTMNTKTLIVSCLLIGGLILNSCQSDKNVDDCWADDYGVWI